MNFSGKHAHFTGASGTGKIMAAFQYAQDLIDTGAVTGKEIMHVDLSHARALMPYEMEELLDKGKNGVVIIDTVEDLFDTRGTPLHYLHDWLVGNSDRKDTIIIVTSDREAYKKNEGKCPILRSRLDGFNTIDAKTWHEDRLKKAAEQKRLNSPECVNEVVHGGLTQPITYLRVQLKTARPRI